MPSTVLSPLLFWPSLALAAYAWISALRGNLARSRWSMAAALPLLTGLFALVTVTRGYPPLHGAYEGSLTTALVLSGCALAFPVHNGRHDKLSAQALLSAAMILVFLPIVWGGTTPMADENMASLLWARLFFICRYLSMGLLLYSGIALCSGALAPTTAGAGAARTQGRNILLLGVCAFLASEVAGCYWCLLGWGDTWHWSGNFFRSTLFYLLIMVACHLPSRWFASYRLRAVCMGAPPLIVFLIVYGMDVGY